MTAPDPTRLSSHMGIAPWPRAALRAVGALRQIARMDAPGLDTAEEQREVAREALEQIGPPARISIFEAEK